MLGVVARKRNEAAVRNGTKRPWLVQHFECELSIGT